MSLLQAKKKIQTIKGTHIKCVTTQDKLTVSITAPNMESEIKLPCPLKCKGTYRKKSDLRNHMKKFHDVSEKFDIELQYYCAENDCIYHLNSGKNKCFAGRKFLNQHMNKVHKIKTYFCNECSLCFATEVDLVRHSKCCSFIYVCQICDTRYDTNEKLMVHLKRKHPAVHQMYKNEKAEKRKQETEGSEDAKKTKGNELEAKPVSETVVTEEVATGTVTETWIFNESANKTTESKPEVTDVCDSPKKSFATQIPEDIRNDVTLPSWQSKTDFETKTDEISTQVGFEDLLSLKSQSGDDDLFFSDPVSLSDIQTQTFPIEFGLSRRSHKETQSCMTSETQSPDLSIKETQTCFCHQDSPRRNFRLFDSLSSSPASTNLMSAETQTADPRHSVKSDVLLSFNSAETQTCFDDSSNDSM